MAFNKEPDGYVKTVLSDPQGSWQNLRHAVKLLRGTNRKTQRVSVNEDNPDRWPGSW